MNDYATSPVSVTGEKKLYFTEALKEVLVGKKIHKIEWKDKEFYGVLDDEILKLHKPDGKLYNWILSLADLSGDDYIVL